jgi:hypothetical protein
MHTSTLLYVNVHIMYDAYGRGSIIYPFMCICALILTLTLVFTPRPHVLLRRVLCLCHGIVQTREGRPVLDPAMSNFDTLGRGWAWGLVALAILLGKTPPPPPLKPNTKHQTY